MLSHFETILGSRNGEVDVPGYRLVGDFVGNLNLEPVFTLGERRQRHALSGLELMARRHIELRRERLRVQRLGRGLVEELFAGLAGLACLRLAPAATWQKLYSTRTSGLFMLSIFGL